MIPFSIESCEEIEINKRFIAHHDLHVCYGLYMIDYAYERPGGQHLKRMHHGHAGLCLKLCSFCPLPGTWVTSCTGMLRPYLFQTSLICRGAGVLGARLPVSGLRAYMHNTDRTSN